MNIITDTRDNLRKQKCILKLTLLRDSELGNEPSNGLRNDGRGEKECIF